MNDEPPAPFDTVGDEHVEARIVAWVLGEASAFEAAELERLCGERPELLVFRRRIEAVHGLLGEAEASEKDHSWKLTPTKRQSIEEKLGMEAAASADSGKEKRIRQSGRRAILAIAACVLFAVVVMKLIPGGYESSVTVQVMPRLNPTGMNPIGPSFGGESFGKPTANFFGTEFEMMKSSENLGKVVDNLDLTDRWKVDRETAVNRLKNRVISKHIPDTSLIDISVKDPVEQDAKEIAHEVAMVYKDRRAELENRDSKKALAELNQAVRDQENKVEERRKALTEIMRSRKIIYSGPDSFYNQSGVDEDKSARDALDTVASLQQEKSRLESQINSLQKHNVDEGAENLKATLQAKLELASANLKSMEGKKDQTHEEAIQRGRVSQDYAEAKRNFEIDQELLQTMKLKQVAERITSAMPSESVVIHEDSLAGKSFASRSAVESPAPPASPADPVEWSKSKASASGGPQPVAERSTIENKSEVAAKKPASVVAGVELKESMDDRAAQQVEPPANASRSRFAGGAPGAPPVATAPAEPEMAASGSAAGGGGRGGPGYDGFANAAPRPTLAPASGEAAPEAKPADGPAALAKNQPEGRTLDEAAKQEVTNGLRSGDSAINRNNIDAILNNPSRPAELRADAQSAPRGVGKDLPALADAAADAAPPPVLGGKKGAETDGRKTEAGYSGLAQREMMSREEVVSKSDALLMFGRDAYSKGDYEQAGDKYRQALKMLPEAPVTADRRESYTEHLNDANVALAMKNRKVGKYEEARKLLDEVIEVDPENAYAKREIGYLDDPIRTNPALTYEHGDNVDKVRRGLYKGEGNFNLGKYDDAKRDYEEVLRIDKYNSAARRGLEQLASAKSDYYRAAYDHTRAELLSQVDAAWEHSVPADGGLSLNSKAAENTRGFYSRSESDTPADARDKGAKDAALAKAMGLEGYAFKLGDDESQQTLGGVVQKPDAEPSKLFTGALNGAAEDQLSSGKSSDSLSRGKDLSEEKANFDIIREFTYPTEYEPPAEANRLSGPAQPFPVTPATPASFAGQSDGAKKPPVVDLARTMDEIAAAENPYSTFSLNISDASFQVAKAALAKGERPDPEEIKVEQFYNAVDYGDSAPTAGEPVAAAIEQAAHPLIPGRNLVRVALRTASSGRSAAQPLRLTLLVDQSGSMAREDRRVAMEQAVKQLGGLLTANDRITVIGFSRIPHLLKESMSGDEGEKLDGLINQAASEGGTNLEEAMKLGGQLAERHQLAGAQNRIVLFTDGAANLGNADSAKLTAQVEAMRQKGIAFDIAGIGAEGLNERLLAELARHGNGRYYVVGDAKEQSFARQLAGAFRPAAENVKVQVNFNPQRVGRYKLIGFEKDRLQTEDFRNDAVDAAELAADEAGVAIYQVEPLAGGTGEIGEVSVRFKDTASGEMVERSWTIPNQSAPAFDRATPSMQLAGLSMLAGEKLRGGPLADATDFKRLAGPQARVKQFYGSSPRVAGMLQVIDALK